MNSSRLARAPYSPQHVMALLIWVTCLVLLPSLASAQLSMRFFGQAVPNVDRVMIQIDPHVPADVGAGDFTLEFWMKANAADNTPGSGCVTNSGENWINGNIIFDRAIWSHDRNGDYGLAMFRTGAGTARLGFGMFQGGTGAALGLCGSANVGDGQWHHVAITRVASSGAVRIYVDGQLDTQGTGPTGNVSYADGVPSSVPPGITLNVDNFLGIGAEKYDADPVRYPSYNGLVDEVRLSTVVRYSSNFSVPSAPFVADANTAALYHFDEGSGTAIVDSSNGNASPGVRRVGSNPTRPIWSTDTPFGSTPQPGNVSFSTATYTVAEAAGTVAVSVTRSGGSSGAASVQYTTTAVTASAGSDYTTTSGTLNWADGDATSRTINVPIVNDSQQESAETFTVTLSNASGATLGAPATTTVTITDDDTPAPTPGTLQFTAATQSVGEAVGSITVTVSRTGGSSGAASVQYATAAGSATAGSDYTTASGTLNWAAGDATNKTFTVSIVNDSTQESAETFTVNLTGATGATQGTPSTATITINDDDTPGPTPGTLQFTTATQSVGEAAGTVTVTVSRTGGSSGAASVQYATAAGSATAGSDYTTASGTLNWLANDATNKTFTVSITNDSTQESAETFTVNLTAATGATQGTPSTVTITINDDDTPGPTPGTLQFTTATQSVGEAAGSITVTVSRTGGSSGAASVQYATAAGSATAGSDFTAASGTLNWAAGDGANKTFTVNITNDSTQESAETFTVNLTGATGATQGTPSTATITINDDDTPAPTPGTLQFTSATQNVGEAAGSITVTVSRTGGSSGAASVQYATAAGSATAGSDYTTASGTLNWADGDATNKTFTVGIVNDSAQESAETFNISLSNASGAMLGSPAATTVTIADDDTPTPTPGTLQFTTSTQSVGEAAGSITVAVSRTGGSNGAASVQYATAAGSATAGGDYTTTSGTLTWAAGDATNKTFTVSIVNDSTQESAESFTVNLTGATGATQGSPSSTTVTIVDDDTPTPTPGTLQFTTATQSVGEAVGSITVTVSRTGGSSGAASVQYATTAGTATAGSDFTAASGTLNWADGDATNKTFTLSIVNDSVQESAETFTVNLSNASGAMSGSPATASITINDDDSNSEPQNIRVGGRLEPFALLVLSALALVSTRRRLRVAA